MASRQEAIDPQSQLNSAIATADVHEIVRVLDDDALDLDRRDVGHDLQTPLMRMCHMHASAEALDTVLEKLETCAWNPNVQDAVGRTLLMHGCIADRFNLVLLCLENGCDVELTDRDGNSALVYAVRNGSDDMVALFLETEQCRALLSRTNNQGQTPLDVAHQDGLVSIETTLAAYSAPQATQHHIPKSTLTPSATLGPPSPLTPRSPAETKRLEVNSIRRTVSDTGTGLGLKHLWGAEEEEGGQGDRMSSKKGGGGGDLAVLVSSRLSKMTKLPSTRTFSQANSTASSTYQSRESTMMGSSLMSSREVTQCSEQAGGGGGGGGGGGELRSPRKSKRKQRLLRRETEDGMAEEEEEGGERGDETHRGGGGGGGGGGGKPTRAKHLQRSMKDSVSLPDLRDFKPGKLVASGEATPVDSDKMSSDQSEKSSDRRRDASGKDEVDMAPPSSYIERYKNGDLSASCSLPPLQNTSSGDNERRKDSERRKDNERRKERAPKLVHGRKNNSTDEVLLRSLIV